MQPTAQAPEPIARVDLNRATQLTPEIQTTVREMFEYAPWGPLQIERGAIVRSALMSAVEVIIENVPPSPDRSAAIRKIREARMDCNSAITHGGKY